jgi:hypothetical protein
MQLHNASKWILEPECKSKKQKCPLLGSVVVRVAVPVKSQVAPVPLFLWK